MALQKSLNTVAARLVQELTLQRSYDYAVNTFHLSTLVEAEEINGQIHSDIDYAPLALGAFTKGVTVRDMASAYGVFGSGGFYNKPYTYYKVLQGEDESTSTLLVGGQKSVMVLDAPTCYVMLNLMKRVTTVGTAADISKSWPGWHVYGKTGTAKTSAMCTSPAAPATMRRPAGSATITSRCWWVDRPAMPRACGTRP